jgi:hypothetical protein
VVLKVMKSSDSTTFKKNLVDELTALQEEWPDEADWAYRLSVCLPPLNDGDISVVPSFTKLAENYFNHLGLACKFFFSSIITKC